MPDTNSPRRVLVSEIIEKDEDRVLMAGLQRGRRVTFHIKRDGSGRMDELVREVEAGSQVWVDLP